MFRDNHTVITVPESPMFNAPEAVEVTVPRLSLVKEAGRQYAKNGMIEAALMEQICACIVRELQAQGLTQLQSAELERQAYAVNDTVADGDLRNGHILLGV